jgi:Ribose/xylose/arabinose/galactoside ABC-type transport systems, permease components
MWELQAITAVVVGGTALRGGVGRIWGTICGAFILEIVGNIMLLSNFVSEYLIGASRAPSSSLRCWFNVPWYGNRKRPACRVAGR